MAQQVVQVAGPRRAPRSRGPAFRGIAPGAGATATVAFGESRRRGRKKRQTDWQPKKKRGPERLLKLQALEAWNAFSPTHLALPRAVGEYTVTRGTREITTNDKLIIVGTWQYSDDTDTRSQGYGRNWCDICALGCADLTKKPSEVAWSNFKMPMLSDKIGQHAQITPSACSVQIMNGNALAGTDGMLFIGKMKVQPTYAGDTVDKASDIAQNFVSYMAPRLCAAGKLALRGIQVDAHPMNMNRLADFTQVYRGFTGSSDENPLLTAWQNQLTPCGFTPIVIYNPNGVNLSLLVCTEYRTRFELFNPACASHKHHPPSSENEWAHMVKRACDLGSGALDIADIVAKSGLAQRFGALMKAAY